MIWQSEHCFTKIEFETIKSCCIRKIFKYKKASLHYVDALRFAGCFIKPCYEFCSCLNSTFNFISPLSI